MKQERARSRVTGRAVMSLVLLLLVMSAARAEAWWNKDWQYRRAITLDTKAGGTDLLEGLRDQEVLVRLHAGNFNFTAAKPDGGDIRFVGPDDKTIIKHQIVSWSQVDEMAIVRVKPPQVTGVAAQDSFFLYYGNAQAAPPEAGAGLADSQQAMLLHLDETEGLPKDATVNGNNAISFTGGLATPGVVGSAISVFGGGERLTLGGSPSLTLPDGLTFTCWLRISDIQNDSYLFRLGEAEPDKKGLVIGVKGMGLFLRAGDGSVTVTAPESRALKPTTWQQVAVTVGNGEAILYLDGIEAVRGPFPDRPGPFAGPITIGADETGGHPLSGDLDEVGLAGVVRSAAWVNANHAIQGPDKGLVAVGVEEVSASGGMMAEQMGYFRIIFSNITIDGYVILGFLAFMGTFAWLVFLGKAYTIWMSGKDTKAFLSAFRNGKGRTCGADESEFESSPLYRVYKQGCRELQEYLGTDENAGGHCGKVSITAVRSALDRSFVLESKALNSWLTALIICTSGGPFLGLLGTVWGVMNTFAAMAAAGEANIMAIAPGVASALVCTVTGLLVAIPSLMGYNFLLVKIKGLTVDMAVFVDEFAVTVEKRYGGEV